MSQSNAIADPAHARRPDKRARTKTKQNKTEAARHGQSVEHNAKQQSTAHTDHELPQVFVLFFAFGSGSLSAASAFPPFAFAFACPQLQVLHGIRELSFAKATRHLSKKPGATAVIDAVLQVVYQKAHRRQRDSPTSSCRADPSWCGNRTACSVLPALPLEQVWHPSRAC